MTDLRDLRDLPAIRAEAERVASALLEAVHLHHGLMSDHTEGCVVEAHLDLLCDLTRPASRDAVARLVAKRSGWDIGTLITDLESGQPSTLARLCQKAKIPNPGLILGPAKALRLIAIATLGATS